MDTNVDLNLLLETGNHAPSVKVVAKVTQEHERLQALLEEAYRRGVRVGLNSELKVISIAIQTNERNLDAVYNFSPLMLQDRIVPPVITQANNLTQNPNGYSLKTTDTIFTIKKQAYFSTTAPNWREYLNFPYSDYSIDMSDTMTKALMPENAEQRRLWREKTTKGFEEGQRQANAMFTHQLNRLNTDYIGMTRFHQFVLEGRISMPSVSRRDLNVMNSGNAIAINQKLLTLRTLPSFDGNTLKWKVFIKPMQYDLSKQNLTINDAVND